MLLQLAIGDAYGGAFEYAPAAFVAERNDGATYAQHPRHSLLPGRYTDDTQMSLAIAEALVSGEPWTPKNLAARFVDAFHRDPREGYATGFYHFLRQTRSGAAFLQNIRPDSDKSGAAMRAAPIGVLPDVADVRERADLQARLTHDTADGRAAAVAAALLAHYFIHNIGARAEVGAWLDSAVPGYQWNEPYRGKVGPKGWMSVRAAVTAIKAASGMRDLLCRCVAFTGDVDTVASVALAAGAHATEFAQDLPEALTDNLENARYGRAYIEDRDNELMRLAARPAAQGEPKL